MREILFRGKTEGKWSKAEWGEGFYCYRRYKYAGDKSFISALHTITTGIIEASGAYQERVDERKYTVIPETVGQYTGLTDKNGTKIFEGDVLKTPAWYTVNDLPCVVIFGEEHTVSNVQGFGLYHYINESYELVCSDEWDEFEVIGNIHDNPELLEGGD